jgi:RimJ/RimL family protein N-acetyltransferase
MLIGNQVALRARRPEDVAVLEDGLYNDVVTRSQADSRPWRPLPESSSASPYAVTEPSPEAAKFSIVERATQTLAGEALLWAIDTHNRSAHIGIAVLSEFRGRGHGTDTLRVLCSYGFHTLGLHRLQLETNAANQPMTAAAESCGFTSEGLLRHAAWSNGTFADQRVMGLLAEDWAPLT